MNVYTHPQAYIKILDNALHICPLPQTTCITSPILITICLEALAPEPMHKTQPSSTMQRKDVKAAHLRRRVKDTEHELHAFRMGLLASYKETIPLLIHQSGIAQYKLLHGLQTPAHSQPSTYGMWPCWHSILPSCAQTDSRSANSDGSACQTGQLGSRLRLPQSIHIGHETAVEQK